jgi:ketosteroid isomerase-like protein
MKQLLLVGIILVFVSAPVLGECSAADKRALEEWDRAWGEAGRVGNRAGLQQYYSDDYTGLNFGGPQTKTQAIDGLVRTAEATRQNPNPPAPATFDNYNINCTPNTAVVTHRNVIKTTVDGKDHITYGRSVHVLEKRGGRWQVIADAGHALSDSAVLAYMEKEWSEAMVKKDTAWFERNLASDYSGVHPITGALMTKAQDIAEIRNMDFTSLEFSDLNTRVEGDTAVVTGVGHARGRDPEGKPFDTRVRFTDVFVRRDGRWQALSAQATVIPE